MKQLTMRPGRIWKIAGCILLLASLLIGMGAPAAGPAAQPIAAQGTLTVTDTGVAAVFPLSLTFTAKASAGTDITEMRLLYTVDRRNFATVVSEGWAQITPSTSVEATWVWDMRKSSLPTGAKVEYWWQARTFSGEEAVTDKRTVTFDDPRFPWRNLTEGLLTLNWYNGDEAFARKLLAAAEEGMTRLEQDTGATLEKPVQVWIYGSSGELQSAMIFPTEWTGGAAYTEHGIIVLGIAPSQVEWGSKAMVHELAHLVVHQMTYSPWARSMPVWLDEGLAQYAEGDPASYDAASFQAAVREGRLISLRSLASSFSAFPDQALLSYAQSFSVVSYMIKIYGNEKMLALLNQFRTGATPDQALMEVYQLDQDSLFEEWKAYVGAR